MFGRRRPPRYRAVVAWPGTIVGHVAIFIVVIAVTIIRPHLKTIVAITAHVTLDDTPAIARARPVTRRQDVDHLSGIGVDDHLTPEIVIIDLHLTGLRQPHALYRRGAGIRRTVGHGRGQRRAAGACQHREAECENGFSDVHPLRTPKPISGCMAAPPCLGPD